MSTFKVEIVTLTKIEKHPNADNLSIAYVQDYPVVIRTADFKVGDKAVYIPIDSLVPIENPLFSFLESNRIKAKKLRGVFSMGLLIPASKEWKEGEDLAPILHITKYDPDLVKKDSVIKVKGVPEKEASPPPIPVPTYTDIEHIRKYHKEFIPGEMVVATEKIHGANTKLVYMKNTLYVGSHYKWKLNPAPSKTAKFLERVGVRKLIEVLYALSISLKVKFLRKIFGYWAGAFKEKSTGNIWWRAVKNQGLEDCMKKIPEGLIVYGETYGNVQDLRYGLSDVRFAAFDIWDTKSGKYLSYFDKMDLFQKAGLPVVPEVYRGPFDYELLKNLTEKDSLVCPGQLMEGLVVTPINERLSRGVGRVILKLISQRYLLRKNA